MKRMVKNGDLIDVKPNGDLGIKGNAQVGGRLQVKSSIISNGEIRGGDISGTKFLLGTEEMPLVKANPTGEATETLEKVKIGNVAYNVGGGGGGGGSDYTAGKNITISEAKVISLVDNIEPVKSISLFNNNESAKVELFQSSDFNLSIGITDYSYFPSIRLFAGDGLTNKDLNISFENASLNKIYNLCFDFSDIKVSSKKCYPLISRERIPDVPSGDGTYILKATVSNGALSYSWIAE